MSASRPERVVSKTRPVTSVFNIVKRELNKPPFRRYPELRAFFNQLQRLRHLVAERSRILFAIAPTLRRVNPRNPMRSQIERGRTRTRKTLKLELKRVETEMAITLRKIMLDHRKLEEQVPDHLLGTIHNDGMRTDLYPRKRKETDAI